jgi:hypothetical protein
MEDFGKAKLDFFRTFLELPNGIPDEKTSARLFARINPPQNRPPIQGNGLSRSGRWEIRIDGKTICGSASRRKGRKARATALNPSREKVKSRQGRIWRGIMDIRTEPALIPDSRIDRYKKHNLVDILFLEPVQNLSSVP